HFERKNSLVIVSVESLENSFFHSDLDRSYLPGLKKQLELGAYHPKLLNVHGATWTIGAFTGHFFGLPLKLPVTGMQKNKYRSKTGFLPNTRNIFDILKENGYETVLLIGSNSRFQSKDILFSGHGQFRIMDRAHFENAGWSLKEHGGTGWGFNDKFVLQRAAEEYERLKNCGKPFVLFVETVDTHSPDGYCPPELRSYNDIRDAIVQSDRNLTEFSKIFMKEPQPNLVYAVLGDHTFMGNPEFLTPVKERTIYNFFYGDLPSIPAAKLEGKISALDIAPTLLQCAGARWNSNKFGLGISLFSDEPSLLEQFGKEEFNRLLGLPSKLYSQFY
ncbi:MAG: sulfatase-like hydrolase/transferase, partial [Desulfovibrionaceae bacterium]|nr:sulfatase-like hydrolase/transferase [Desulfovibrionaceae bacterium]